MNAALPRVATAVNAIAPAPVVYLHVAIFTPHGTLGDETFRLVSLQGQESVSETFEIELELHGNSSAQGRTLSFDDVVGQPVSVGVHYPAFDAQDRQATREESNGWFQAALQGSDESTRLAFFNGIAAGFSLERPGVYHLTLRPALWKLTLTNNYCVHAQMSVRDAIESLLRRHRLDFSVDALMGSDNLAVTRVQDWLQAGESDYDYLKRLMAKAHIYFFFVFGARSHKVVFANRPAYPQAMPGGAPLRYCSTDAQDLGLTQPDVVTDYRLQQTMAPSAVATVFTREESAWEVDPLPGFHSYRAQSQPQPGELPFHQYMVYEYGCSSSEVGEFVGKTQSTLDASRIEFSATGYCPFLRSGHQFTLTQYPREGQWPAQVDPALEGLRLVATHVEHQATLDGVYTNKMRAAPAGGLVAPFSLQDTQQGSVLAQVVAANGSSATAPATWRYYSPDNFDPETSPLSDSDSQEPTLQAQGVCVRFSTDPEGGAPVWVKLASHMETAPEIGTMVLVARAQDQSELPEVQQIIHNNGSKVVKPSGWTATTTVGSNWSTSYGDSLSVRFGLRSPADLDTATAIVNGKYASGAYRECSYAQGATYSYATSDQGASGLLSTSDSFGSAYSTHQGTVNSSVTQFETMLNDSTVSGTSTSRNTIATSISTSTIGTQTETSQIGTQTSTATVGTQTSTTTVGTQTSTTEVGTQAETSQIGTQTSTTKVGTQTSTTEVSTQMSTSSIGSSHSQSSIGTQQETSSIGTSMRNTFAGATSEFSMSGAAKTVSIKGASSQIDLVGAGANIQLAGAQFVLQETGFNIKLPEFMMVL